MLDISLVSTVLIVFGLIGFAVPLISKMTTSFWNENNIVFLRIAILLSVVGLIILIMFQF